MRETKEEEQETVTVTRVGTAPEALDLPGCVQERHHDPDGRAPSASRSPSRGGKRLSGGSTREKGTQKKKLNQLIRAERKVLLI